jgi:hypothetical protein
MPEQAADAVVRMLTGYWVSQIAGTLAALAIPDHLLNGPRSPAELAKDIGCNADATHRLLRASASIDLISPTNDGRFTLTPLGKQLASNVPGSLRDMAITLTAPGHWLPWGCLTEAVRTGERQARAALGHELFDYYAANPHEGDAFSTAMSNHSAAVAQEVADAIDTSGIKHVVDVGGASGAILATLLKRNPSLRGTILELAHVVPQARAAVAELGLSSVCKVLEGDFFKRIPTADILILKYIIHDWDDEQSIRILANCAGVLETNGRVILVERVLPEDGRASRTPLSDLNMLVLLPGRERTVRQYADLLEAAGLRLGQVVETPSAIQILHATAVPKAGSRPT